MEINNGIVVMTATSARSCLKILVTHFIVGCYGLFSVTRYWIGRRNEINYHYITWISCCQNAHEQGCHSIPIIERDIEGPEVVDASTKAPRRRNDQAEPIYTEVDLAYNCRCMFIDLLLSWCNRGGNIVVPVPVVLLNWSTNKCVRMKCRTSYPPS